jgi:hypothetical protein
MQSARRQTAYLLVRDVTRTTPRVRFRQDVTATCRVGDMLIRHAQCLAAPVLGFESRFPPIETDRTRSSGGRPGAVGTGASASERCEPFWACGHWRTASFDARVVACGFVNRVWPQGAQVIWPLRPGFSTEAVQAPVRVKVMWVTPLGEEVVSIS